MSLTREQTVIVETIKTLTELIPTISKIEKDIIDKPTDLEFLANTAYVARKCIEICKMTEKILGSMGDKAENQACILFANMDVRRYTTDYCTVSPNPTFYVPYPTSPDKEGFAEFVKQLPLEAIRPHYPTVETKVCESIEQGKGIPFGLKEIRGAKLALRVTTKKEL